MSQPLLIYVDHGSEKNRPNSYLYGYQKAHPALREKFPFRGNCYDFLIQSAIDRVKLPDFIFPTKDYHDIIVTVNCNFDLEVLYIKVYQNGKEVVSCTFRNVKLAEAIKEGITAEKLIPWLIECEWCEQEIRKKNEEILRLQGQFRKLYKDHQDMGRIRNME